MGFADGVEKASDYAKMALDLMDAKGVPAAPPNYTVWYNYVSDRFPDLKKKLDELIETDQAFDGNQNADLYDTFVGHGREGVLVQDTGEQMQEQAREILLALGGASEEIKGASSSIKKELNSFVSEQSLGGIEGFIQNMILETRRIQKTNDDLQAKLNQSSEKIQLLQENLQQAEEEIYTDALTGIANRKKFDVALLAEMAAAQKSGEPLCLVVGDIDEFKRFNDTYGHQVGDQVLKLVAHALHNNVKGSDLAVRYGGEEFALILPNTISENAYRLVETIRKAIGTKRIHNKQKDMDYGSVTLSLGLAQYRPDEAVSDFIERTDSALYRAKGEGRNRTVCEEGMAVSGS